MAHQTARQVTWLSIGVNVATGIVKVAAGFWGQSRALIADGLHSLTDLATDAAVLLGLGYAARPPDDSHLYGHHKATSIVSLFIALAILAFCALLIADSVRALVVGEAVAPHWPTLAIALASVAVKEWLFHRTRRVGHDSKSSLVLTNAWHHRTDSVTSIVAAVGIGGSIFFGDEWRFLDSAVGVLLGGYLASEGGKILLRTMKDLMDTAPEQTVIDDLREHILSIPGAIGYHAFRARRVGDMIEVDFHLFVPPDLSVQDGHHVASRVKREILARHPEVITVLIHVEPSTPEHAYRRGVAELDADASP